MAYINTWKMYLGETNRSVSQMVIQLRIIGVRALVALFESSKSTMSLKGETFPTYCSINVKYFLLFQSFECYLSLETLVVGGGHCIALIQLSYVFL